MMTLKKIEAIAMEAQKAHIQRLMLWNTGGGGMRRIEKWDDFLYHLSWFFTPKGHVGSMSDSNIRRWMQRLVESGAVELDPHRRPYGSLRWRFPREVCDKMAADAIKRWQEIGYSQDESRMALHQKVEA